GLPSERRWKGTAVLADWRRPRSRAAGKRTDLFRETNPDICEDSPMTERRRFIATASGVVAAAAAAAVVDAPYVIAPPKVQWRMSTTWTPALDMLQGSAQLLGTIVERTSGGRFRIEVFPGGQIMPGFACFEAASKGTIEIFMGAPYYWVERTNEP